jgi:hypothetical protein
LQHFACGRLQDVFVDRVSGQLQDLFLTLLAQFLAMGGIQVDRQTDRRTVKPQPLFLTLLAQFLAMGGIQIDGQTGKPQPLNALAARINTRGIRCSAQRCWCFVVRQTDPC